MSPSKLPHAITLIVDHLWHVFQPISAALPPGLPFVGSSDDDEDDASAPQGDLPGIGALTIPPVPDERAPPVALAPLEALPGAPPDAPAPPAAANPGALESGRLVIPADLP